MTTTTGMVKIVGYHTSKADGGWQHIFNNAPFLSKKMPTDRDPKWLTDGYYLWTDSLKFAKIWGRNAIRSSEGYAITKSEIFLESTELLDLVGNVGHQETFEAAFKFVAQKLTKKPKDVIIPEVIQYFRDHLPSEFRWIAIKAYDVGGGKDKKASFNRKSVPEITYFPTRQQICVFECARSKIKNTEVVYPEEYRVACEAAGRIRSARPKLKVRR